MYTTEIHRDEGTGRISSLRQSTHQAAEAPGARDAQRKDTYDSDHNADERYSKSHREVAVVTGGRTSQTETNGSHRSSESSLPASNETTIPKPPTLVTSLGGSVVENCLPCEFRILGCQIVFQLKDVDRWIEHGLGHFRHSPLPAKAMCIFCDEIYCVSESIGDLEANWRQRQLHIAFHFIDLQNISESRPDFGVLDHMQRHGLISQKDFEPAISYTDRPYRPNWGWMTNTKEKTRRKIQDRESASGRALRRHKGSDPRRSLPRNKSSEPTKTRPVGIMHSLADLWPGISEHDTSLPSSPTQSNHLSDVDFTAVPFPGMDTSWTSVPGDIEYSRSVSQSSRTRSELDLAIEPAPSKDISSDDMASNTSGAIRSATEGRKDPIAKSKNAEDGDGSESSQFENSDDFEADHKTHPGEPKTLGKTTTTILDAKASSEIPFTTSLEKEDMRLFLDRSGRTTNSFDHPRPIKGNSFKPTDHAVAIFDFTPKDDNELRLKAGELLWIQNFYGNGRKLRQGWFLGSHTKFGEDCGFVPATQIRIIDHKNRTDMEFMQALGKRNMDALSATHQEDQHAEDMSPEVLAYVTRAKEERFRDIDKQTAILGDSGNSVLDFEHRTNPVQNSAILAYNEITGSARKVLFEYQIQIPLTSVSLKHLNHVVEQANTTIQEETSGCLTVDMSEESSWSEIVLNFAIVQIDSAWFLTTGDIQKQITKWKASMDIMKPAIAKQDHAMPEGEEEEDNQSDISGFSGSASLASVADSVFSIFSASSMSSAIAADSQGAVERLVSFFLGDTEIEPLCTEGLSCIPPARFENNFRRLLKEFALALRKEAETAEHRQAAKFVRHRSRNTAHIICNKLNNSPVKLENVSCQLPPFPTPMAEKDEQEQQELSDNSSDSERDEDTSDNLHHLETFIINSAALKLLRERLRNFVRPPSLQKNEATTPEADATTISLLAPTWEFEFAEFPEIQEELGAKEDHIVVPSAKKSEIVEIRNFKTFSRSARRIADVLGIHELDSAVKAFPNITSPLQIWHLVSPLGSITQRLENAMKRSTAFVQDHVKPQLPGYLPPVKPGQTRIEITCKCGQKIIDDYTEHTPGGIVRFREMLNTFAPDTERKSFAAQVTEKSKRLSDRLGLRCSATREETRAKAIPRLFKYSIRGFVFAELLLCFELFAFYHGYVLSDYMNARIASWIRWAPLALLYLETLKSIWRLLKNPELPAGKISTSQVQFPKNSPPKSPITHISMSPASSQASTNSESSIMSMLSSFRDSFSWKTKATTDSERGLPLHSPPVDPTTNSAAPGQTSMPPSELLFLLLCYSSGRYATRLLQLDLHSLNTRCDQSLFTLLRTNYLSMRKSFFSLKRLQSIKFVRFEMYQSELVDVRKIDDIPPPDHVDYRYMPTPIDVVPPVGENLMMHLFTHPTDASTLPDLLSRFPKKLHTPLHFRPGLGMHPSWGLQYVEAWDLAKLWMITFVLFGGGSLLWGILWAIYGKSVQDAFAVSAYVVAMVGVFGGTSQALLVL